MSRAKAARAIKADRDGRPCGRPLIRPISRSSSIFELNFHEQLGALMKQRSKQAIKIFSLISLGCFVLLSLTSCGKSRVDKSYIDQQFEFQQACIKGAYQILDYEPLGQEFIPTKPNLVAVDVRLSDWNPPHEDTITLNIRGTNLAGPILATASQYLGSLPEATWVHFDLPTTDLVPGAIYVIELLATNMSFAVNEADNYGNNPECNYPNGSFYLSNVQQSMDMYFRTYYAR